MLKVGPASSPEEGGGGGVFPQVLQIPLGHNQTAGFLGIKLDALLLSGVKARACPPPTTSGDMVCTPTHPQNQGVCAPLSHGQESRACPPTRALDPHGSESASSPKSHVSREARRKRTRDFRKRIEAIFALIHL